MVFSCQIMPEVHTPHSATHYILPFYFGALHSLRVFPRVHLLIIPIVHKRCLTLAQPPPKPAACSYITIARQCHVALCYLWFRHQGYNYYLLPFISVMLYNNTAPCKQLLLPSYSTTRSKRTAGFQLLFFTCSVCSSLATWVEVYRKTKISNGNGFCNILPISNTLPAGVTSLVLQRLSIIISTMWNC